MSAEQGSPTVAPAPAAPTALSVTALVTYARCPKQFYWSVVRPLPRRAAGAARVGTEVHRWIEERAGRQLTLLEPADESPDIDAGAMPPVEPGVVARLKESFLASEWAELDPARVEAPFTLVVGNHVIRGRVDAVYERPDLGRPERDDDGSTGREPETGLSDRAWGDSGRIELVDFKTGRVAEAGDPSAGVQLDIYGLAAVDAWRADPDRIRTTYCYLRTDGAPMVESVDWTAATVDKVRADLAASLDAIAGARFDAAPGAWCGRCDFLSFCSAGRSVVYKHGLPARVAERGGLEESDN